MIVKQKSIRAFEFRLDAPEDEAQMQNYITQNRELLQGFLISVEGAVSEALRAFLQASGLRFVASADTLHRRDHKDGKLPEPVQLPERIEAAPPGGGLISYHAPIRSGNDLECDDDIAVFGRINSGARVFAKKNAIIFSTIDGTVEACGEYLILQKIGKGQVFFHGEAILAKSLNGHVCKVTMKNGEVAYEELS
jgi:septum site-determining protein MinC